MATTRIPPLLVLDCMGYKADLSVSFNFLKNPASAGFLLSGFCWTGKRSAGQTTSILIFATLSTFHCFYTFRFDPVSVDDRHHKISR
ncbi:hypothetical protein [Enterobacter asburiae]|uniref:hypothetical protein n=1 Tax=Enterobacter asburiae TaxID=61645 RepID=UPI001BD16AC0|nr:hypothetical protein [Enterobacter asburiae]HCU0700689.1 hypothetical protein [Enterobacter asburiae]